MKLEELPQLSVATIEGTVYSLVLKGRFSRPHFVHKGDCWLRMPDGFPFYATVVDLDTATGHATLGSNDELRPQLVPRRAFPWFDAYWGSNQVNIILDPEHTWSETIFQASDAYERAAPDTALGTQRVALDGRTWREALGAPAPGERLVKSGWDHEHCLICFVAIRPGDGALVDPDGYWLCNSCYAKYAAAHDLAFMYANGSDLTPNPSLQRTPSG